MTQKVNVVILAAGKGTRMKSRLPKVLHCVGGKSLLQHNLDLAAALAASSVSVVVGHAADDIRSSIPEKGFSYVLQEQQLGTGHAVAQTLDELEEEAVVLVLYGDVPLIDIETVSDLLALSTENKMAVLTCVVEDPAGLGRIIRNDDGLVQAIVEEKDASAEQRHIREINTGIMAIPVNKLKQWLPRLKDDNAQNEYYLTDVISLAVADGCEVSAKICQNPMEVQGVNNRLQLAELERYYQRCMAQKLMLNGVTLADPARVDIRGDVVLAEDVSLDINIVLEGSVKIESGVSIGPNCVLKNCHIAADTTVNAYTHIEDADIGRDCSIGPFARIRPGTVMEQSAKIGNFVETKKAYIGKGSKINHLSYVGDSQLGKDVNIGAGTITCNYDGVNKHKTIIGNEVFVGSNTALVAPVTIADGATIGAGSTITKDVGDEVLALSRSEQKNIIGWKRPVKK